MKVRVRVPASTSNLGPGFDCLGLALNRHLVITVETVDGNHEPVISVTGNGASHIATDRTNLVYRGMEALAESSGRRLPSLRVTLENGIPSCGGLGGSGAAIAGGVFAANELLGTKLSRMEMLAIALKIEGHPDNVSAALLGGLTINAFDNGNVRSRSVKIRWPLSVVTCSPEFQVLTSEARRILPKEIPLRDAVVNVENVAALVAAMIEGDAEVLRYATGDRLHEQHRAKLIPGYDEVRAAALGAGALSCNISGAGPTLFCFAKGKEEAIGKAMKKAFVSRGIRSISEVMHIENEGASVI